MDMVGALITGEQAITMLQRGYVLRNTLNNMSYVVFGAKHNIEAGSVMGGYMSGLMVGGKNARYPKWRKSIINIYDIKYSKWEVLYD